MGYGDKLMAIGDAWAQHQRDPQRRRVAIGDGVNLDPQFPELSEGLDFLAPEASVWREDLTWVISYRGKRPYIDYVAMQQELAARGQFVKRSKAVGALGRYIWREGYHATPAPIVLRPDEQAIYERWRTSKPFVIIEPYVKAKAPPSKQWPVERFFEVGQRLMKDMPVYQFCPPGREPMDGFRPIRTTDFRDVFPYLKAAALYLGPEGGLHHAAAAMGTRGVVLYGGFISPKTTGYPDLHTNLTGDTAGYACGTRYGMCPHCAHAFSTLTPDLVLENVRRQLEKTHG
jgi:hypothetical protein